MSETGRGLVVGVDVGGTFTDLILLESGGAGGNVRLAKVPSTLTTRLSGCSTHWPKAARTWPIST